MRQSVGFRRQGKLLEVPENATDPTERVLVVKCFCSQPYAPLSGIYAVQKQARERDNSATLAKGLVVYVKPNHKEIDVTTEMRLRIRARPGGTDREYRIRDVTRWPDVDPDYYELLVEAE